ncbi:hypothetical protein [Candidatus Enterovibrio escicola]|nr:hypothetical protein [Candidatus Enterovibrio escacola]
MNNLDAVFTDNDDFRQVFLSKSGKIPNFRFQNKKRTTCLPSPNRLIP